jgi:CIC family chloride channel protein
LKLRRRGIDILKLKNEVLLEKINVSEAMFRKIITINESATVSDAESLLKSSSHRGFPVLDSNGRLKGMITHQDIYDALEKGRRDITVAEIMSNNLVTCYPEETLKNALEKLGEHDIGRIPVIENNDTGKLIGLITRKNIVSTYNKALKN